MRPRSIFVAAFFLAVIPYATASEPTRKGTAVEPPRWEVLSNTASQPREELADVLAIKPELPLGPSDVLKEYEIGMALIAQKMSADIGTILQAQQTNQITREQAEYLIGERYQVAMMQYQVLSGMHEALERDVAQAAASAKRPGTSKESDGAVVVELPSSGQSGGYH